MERLMPYVPYIYFFIVIFIVYYVLFELKVFIVYEVRYDMPRWLMGPFSA